jgi:hypothetical protein
MYNMKRCTWCEEKKENKEFFRDTYARDGLTYQCKECMASQAKLTKEFTAKLKEKLRKDAIPDFIVCSTCKKQKSSSCYKQKNRMGELYDECINCNDVKTCGTCNLEKSVTDFQSAGRGKLSIHCKACISARRKEERKKNREENANKTFHHTGERWCGTCKQLKSVDAFHRNLSRKDGLQLHCRACVYVKSVTTRERHHVAHPTVLKKPKLRGSKHFRNNKEQMSDMSDESDGSIDSIRKISNDNSPASSLAKRKTNAKKFASDGEKDVTKPRKRRNGHLKLKGLNQASDEVMSEIINGTGKDNAVASPTKRRRTRRIIDSDEDLVICKDSSSETLNITQDMTQVSINDFNEVIVSILDTITPPADTLSSRDIAAQLPKRRMHYARRSEKVPDAVPLVVDDEPETGSELTLDEEVDHTSLKTRNEHQGDVSEAPKYHAKNPPKKRRARRIIRDSDDDEPVAQDTAISIATEKVTTSMVQENSNLNSLYVPLLVHNFHDTYLDIDLNNSLSENEAEDIEVDSSDSDSDDSEVYIRRPTRRTQKKQTVRYYYFDTTEERVDENIKLEEINVSTELNEGFDVDEEALRMFEESCMDWDSDDQDIPTSPEQPPE